MKTNIWQKISHDNVLNVVEDTIGQKLTNLFLPRNSYINRVFELELADSKKRIVVKFYRPARWTRSMIQTEHDLLSKLAIEELAVIQPLNFKGQTLFEFEGIFFAVFPKKGGRIMDELDKDQWQQIGRLIGRTHAISSKLEHPDRIVWRPQKATSKHLEVLGDLKVIPQDYQEVFFNTAKSFISNYDSLFNKKEFILLHGDCHPGNFIYRPGEGIYIIDFDDMCIGPVVQDLWMLLPDTLDKCENEIAWFIEGYETFCDFPRQSLKLIPALRVMRIIHFASWCAIQSFEPGFKHHFSEWGTVKYWNETLKMIQKLV
ncbi:serine/threonine protein kinase [bacterium]|nr:serine/threonine protein kinase [bacterium]